MQHQIEDEILHTGITLMSFIGEDSSVTSKKLLIFRLFNCCLMVYLLVFVFANFLQAEFGMYVKNVQSAVSVFHMLFKYLLFIYFKRDIERLFTDKSNFWDYRKFSRIIRKRTDKVYQFINGVQNSAIVTSLVAVLMYFLKPVSNSDDTYILEAWIFIDSTIVGVTVLACQYYFILVITAIVIGYDSIYLSFCTHIVLQLKLLKFKLHRLSEHSHGSAKKEIRRCISHHQLLTSIFKRMKRIYSLMLLFHYFVTLATGCIDLYELLIRKSNLSYMMVMIVSLIFIYAQFGYYAIPAEVVATEFSDLSNSIYMTKWYDNRIEIQKLLLLMMVRSQRQEYFSGGGMIDMNIYTYGSVIRKTFSFYAILRSVFNK